MNKIFKAIMTGQGLKEKKPTRLPLIAAFDKNGECLGSIPGNDENAAFLQFPKAVTLNVIPLRGKNKVITKPA